MIEHVGVTEGLTVMNIMAIVFYAGMHWQKGKYQARQFGEMKEQIKVLDEKISNGLSARVSKIDKEVGEIQAVCKERGKQLEQQPCRYHDV